MNEVFRHLAKSIANVVGMPWTFVTAVAVIVAWSALGPIFHYSDTWQLVINTSTSIMTFLMVFLLQNTQNRDATAIHLKLDELLRAVADARNGMIELENMSDEQLATLREEFQRLCADRGTTCETKVA